MASHRLRGRAVIAGVGHTAYGALPGRSTTSMIVEAARRALDDAGVEKGMIDAVLVKPPTSAPQLMNGQRIAEALGVKPRIGMGWDQGGAANIGMISYAVMAIEAGLCQAALICFADNPKTGSRHVYGGAKGDDAVFGWFGVPPAYALSAQRHMQEFGTTVDHLGAVAVAARRNGASNPNAQLRRAITLEEHRESKIIAAPLRRDDCALVSDGGAALVVTSAALARENGIRAPVSILGFGFGQTSWDIQLRHDLTTTMAVESGAAAFQMAGLGPEHIDMAQLYDCFSIVPIMTLEDYGFCKKGQGGPFVSGGRIELNGDLPVNTSGGLLSETGMPGMQLIIEGVRQLRGEAVNQVARNRTCIVSNQGGILHTHATLILGQ